MQLARKTEYGLVFLGALRHTYRSGRYHSLAVVARKNRLPVPFVEKLAADLKREGIIAAERGARGGYRLAKNPEKISVREVLRVLGEPSLVTCMRPVLPRGKPCPLAKACPLRIPWVQVEKQINGIFEKISVAEL